MAKNLGPHSAHSARTSSSVDDGSDLASVFGSLRPSAGIFMPSASLSSPRGHDTADQERAVVKADTDNGHDRGFLERARSDLAEQNQLMLYGKVLRLSEQVEELVQQVKAAQEKQNASDRTVQELRQQLAGLKTHANTHNVQIDANKKLLSECAREAHQANQRVDQSQKAIQQQLEQVTKRFGNVEALARKTENTVNDHHGRLKEDDVRLSDIEDKMKGQKKIVKLDNGINASSHASSHASPRALSQGPTSTTEIRSLQTSQAEVRNYLRQVGEKLVEYQDKISAHDETIAGMREHIKHQNEIALASKFKLEELFIQLTKEMHGECHGEEIVFGVDADKAFALRQRVLERVAIDNMVQIEFERLKVLPH